MNNDTTEFDADQYAHIYPVGIERWYWHRARNRIVTRKLRARLSARDRILDLGCGVGVLVAHLRGAGFDCEGTDLGRPLWVVAGAKGHVRLGQDAFALPAAYREGISAILLMDVLEHLPEPGEFLQRCAESFPSVHCVFATVPARMEIWSNYDEYNGHYRRYTMESLRSVAAPNGFALLEIGHFFHTLYWAARIHKKIARERSTTLRPPRLPLLHDVIGHAMSWEERILPTASRGASLYAVYTRQPRAS